MTFSIVARQGPAFGVAVASRFLAVGAVVPGARSGVGAVATQSWARVAYVEELLDRLARGEDAEAVLAAATAADDGRATRQVGLVGAASAATFTGDECLPWCGGVSHVAGDEARLAPGGIDARVLAALRTATRD